MNFETKNKQTTDKQKKKKKLAIKSGDDLALRAQLAEQRMKELEAQLKEYEKNAECNKLIQSEYREELDKYKMENAKLQVFIILCFFGFHLSFVSPKQATRVLLLQNKIKKQTQNCAINGNRNASAKTNKHKHKHKHTNENSSKIKCMKEEKEEWLVQKQLFEGSLRKLTTDNDELSAHETQLQQANEKLQEQVNKYQQKSEFVTKQISTLQSKLTQHEETMFGFYFCNFLFFLCVFFCVIF